MLISTSFILVKSRSYYRKLVSIMNHKFLKVWYLRDCWRQRKFWYCYVITGQFLINNCQFFFFKKKNQIKNNQQEGKNSSMNTWSTKLWKRLYCLLLLLFFCCWVFVDFCGWVVCIFFNVFDILLYNYVFPGVVSGVM